MKSLIITIAVVFALLFLLVTINKIKRAPAPENVEEGVAPERKKEIKEFWETYSLAEENRVNGNEEDAITLYRNALKINPVHENSLYFLGSLLSEEGNFTEALTVFKKLVDVNPRSVRAHSHIGLILSSLSPGALLDLGGAREEFEKCIEINREESGPFFHLGRIDLYSRNYDDAHQSFDAVTKLNFKNLKAYRLSALGKIRQGKEGEAFHLYEKALEVGAGVLSAPAGDVPGEGDTEASLETPSLRKGENLLALFGLYWTAQKLGGYPEETREDFRIALSTPNIVSGLSGFKTAKSIDIVGKEDAGRGCAWGDYDGDGDPDLAIVGLTTPITLYRNNGNNRFTDVTNQVGLSVESAKSLPAGRHGAEHGWDVMWADVDGDRDLDLYTINSGWIGKGENFLYRNNGGKFSLVTKETGLDGMRGTAEAHFFDMDNDNDLDLIEVGSTLAFFQNEKGKFQNTTVSSGLKISEIASNPEGESAGVNPYVVHTADKKISVDCAVGDYDGDGLNDLFILYWKTHGKLYRNRGKGKFEDVTLSSGISQLFPGYTAEFLDYNNDGKLDLLIAPHAPYEDVLACLLNPDLQMNHGIPHLYHNNGDGTFRDVAQDVGLIRSYGTMDVTPFDFDSNGWTDLYIATGGFDVERQEPDVLLRNTGKGFEEIYLFGDGFPGKSLKVSPADFDGDGDVDIYVSRGGVFPGDRWTNRLYVNQGLVK
jgi:tetratricopeptide (TPR) repeat protein